MKYLIFLLFPMAVWAAAADSLILPTKKALTEECDACGCSVGGASSGFESFLNAQFVGIRYLYQRYTSRSAATAYPSDLAEYYHTTQLWTRVPIGKKTEVFGSLPFHAHSRNTYPTQSVSGVGDLNISTLFRVVGNSVAGHRLYVGAGVKIPLARFDQGLTGISYNPSFQLGTGSWDWNALLNYTFIRGRWASSFSADYILKGQNPRYYRFGDQLNLGLGIHYLEYWGEIKLSPRIGLQTEVYAPNVEAGQEVPHTGGYILFSKVGAEASFKKLSSGVEVQLPWAQQLSDNQVRIDSRVSLFLNFRL